MRTHSQKKTAFTLIEMLIVVAIIAILSAILFPVFARSREKARAASCLSNYHQVGIAIQMYAQDSDDKTPANGGSFSGLIQDSVPYIHTSSVFVCPDDDDREEESRAGSYRVPTLYQGKPLSCGWINPYAAGQITTTATTTLSYEAEQDFSQSPIVPTYRHSSGTQVLFFDGHAKWLPK
jgi:prepilin-type N-terminal cleavage/methylation domain-containing protein/prepilin-type processing-associated H-X9-DG protein